MPPPLADEREDNLKPSPGPSSTKAVYLQSRGCFSLLRAAVELSITTRLCTSFIRTLSWFWYMSHFIPYNSCTSPTLGLRGLEFSYYFGDNFHDYYNSFLVQACPVCREQDSSWKVADITDGTPRRDAQPCSDTDKMFVCASHLLSSF